MTILLPLMPTEFRSQSRLSHLFKEQIGIPLKSYIQFHPMKQAFLALLHGKSITEAALATNFDSPSHFTKDFNKLSIDWHGDHTYAQSAAIITDHGVFESPDIFFKDHAQHWSKIKNFLYVHFGRNMMNHNVNI